MQFNVEKFIAGLHDYIGKALTPIAERIKALEARQPEKGEKGQDGINGVDGKDGSSVELPEVIKEIEPKVESFLAEIQIPKDGANGVDGKDGLNGNDGTSVTVDDVLPVISKQVEDFLSAVKLPENGKDGIDGKNGNDGVNGKDGIDGKSFTIDEAKSVLSDLHESMISKWALDFERRAHDTLQKSIDRMPKPKDGIDGKNAVGFDDLSVEHDGLGNVSIKFANANQVKFFDIRLPVLIDKGIFREENDYLKGDCASFGGSLWIAQKDAPFGKPGLTDDWRLAVKRGRDGKDYTK